MKKMLVPKTYHIDELGDSSNAAEKTCWLVCHGYGQLPGYFKQKFSSIDLENNYLVFPEACNQYYLAGYNGRVGANWMTSHHRLDAIQDINAYLSTVYSHFKMRDFKKVVLLGFSQGAYSIVRWVVDEGVNCDAVVVWGARLAEDYFRKYIKVQQDYNLYLVYGSKDELVPTTQVQSQIGEYDKYGLKYEVIRYEGGHDIFSEPLQELQSKI